MDSVAGDVTVHPADPSTLEKPDSLQSGDLLLLAEQVSSGLSAFQWLRRLRGSGVETPAVVLVKGSPSPPPKDLEAVDVLGRRALSAHDLNRSLGFLRRGLGDARLTEDLLKRLRAMASNRRQDDSHQRLLELAGAYKNQLEAREQELEEARRRIQELETQDPSPAKSVAPPETPKAFVERLEKMQADLESSEEIRRRQESVLSDVRLKLGGGADTELPDRISALTARLMVAEWTGATQLQNMQYLQQRVEDMEQHFKALAAILETPQGTADLNPTGLLEQVADRLLNFEKQRSRQQGTIDQLSHSLAVQQVDDTFDNAQSRRNVLHRLDDALTLSRHNGKPLTCLLAAIDEPEDLREQHGSVAYDFVLVQLAQRLKLSLRQQDTLLRYDDESFVLITNAVSIKAAYHHAKRLVELVNEAPVLLGSEQIAPSISVAVTVRHPFTDDGTDLLKRAQQILAHARGKGRNQVAVDPEAETTVPE